ncbi:MAG: gamma-glutamyltransferase [Ignavibacteriae bacterium]|nr:gamma-glutamyltransferase [Ignavibacteriota bacterium]
MIQKFFLCLTLAGIFSLNMYAAVRGKHTMVVSANQHSSEAGIEILKRGGNAIDAAVAVGYALAVTFPEAGNIGGGGFMLIRTKDGNATVIDFRETAPAKSTRNMFLDDSGNVSDKSINGHLSVGVPGTVAGFSKALELFGKKKLKDVIMPAIKLAERGFVVDRRLESNLEWYKDAMLQFPPTAKVFAPKGTLLMEGDTFRQPELAATLKRIQKFGSDEFYKGKTAKLLVEEMKRGGGIITLEDLKNYKVEIRQPVEGMYRGYKILSVPPPSSGGIALIQMLNILEGFTLDSTEFHSSRSVHLMTESMKRAFADRYEFASDPLFVSVPTDRLLSQLYLSQLKFDIDSINATPAEKIKHGIFQTKESDNTTHYVVADEEGNVVSVTYTQNDLFGSKVTVAGAGFLLNDIMDDFTAKPGVANLYGLVGTEKNAIEPGKRPVSAMAPTIVVKDSLPFLALGARGGPRIITSVFQTIVNVIDFKMSVERAVNESRFHHQLYPDSLMLEPYALPNDVIANLRAKGHNMMFPPYSLAQVEALFRDPLTGWYWSGADRREGGVALGY